MQKRKNKIYIGLVGEIGGGKDTVMKFMREFLPRKKIAQIRFSDALSETLDLWCLPRTRKNYQKLSPIMVDTYGPSTLANIIRTRAEAAVAEVVFLNGVRWWADLKMLKRLNRRGAKSFLVYVTAPAKTRYERLLKRGEKAGEKGKTLRKFMAEEKARADAEIPKIGKKADVKIDNSGSLEDFRQAVKKQILPLLTKKNK